jgi:hypothetical protein
MGDDFVSDDVPELTDEWFGGAVPPIGGKPVSLRSSERRLVNQCLKDFPVGASVMDPALALESS